MCEIRIQSVQWAGRAGLDTAAWAASVQAAESEAVHEAKQMHALYSNNPKRFVKQHRAFVQHCGGSVPDTAALRRQLEHFLFGCAMAKVPAAGRSQC